MDLIYLEEFFDYKNQLMKDILTNERIIDLLTDGQVDVKDASKLAYDQVWPVEYVAETLEEGKTFICFDVDINRAENKTFLFPYIYVWVFSHRSKVRYYKGGVRPDLIASELAKVMDGSRVYGLGELKLYSASRFVPLTDWVGKVLMFTAYDVSKTHPTGKPIPANRKDHNL